MLFTLTFISCTREPVNNLPSRHGMPDQESWGVEIMLSNQGEIRAVVQSGHLEKYHEKNFIMLDNNVKVDFYDNQENHTSVLTSFKAEIDQRTNNMNAVGDVVAKSDSGITLHSATLTWVAKEEKLITKDSIRITTQEKDTIYGIGFESDSDLKNWKILKPTGTSSREFQ